MITSLRASTEGLVIIDRARQRRGWTKTSTARWWQDAHTSRATLRRFWQRDRIQRDIFIALCQVVGVIHWEAIAEAADIPEIDDLELDTTGIQQETRFPQVDLNEAPDIERFYGRDRELEQLQQWVTDSGKLLQLAGMAGIGKTSLALVLTERVQAQFKWVIWRSLHSYPTLLDLLGSLPNTMGQPTPLNSSQGIHQLLQLLQQHRCLLVLDGLDADWWRQNRQDYTELLHRLGRDRHQSCAIITGRISSEVIEAEGSQSVKHLTLKGLQQSEGITLIQAKALKGTETELSALHHTYGGHPLALQIAASVIQSLFSGNVKAFLKQSIFTSGHFQELLKQQLNQLSLLEQEIAYWLAIWQEPVSFSRLQTHLLGAPDPTLVLTGIAGLERQSLLEKRFSVDLPLFTLQPVVMTVATIQLVEQAVLEIAQVLQSNDINHFKVVKNHWLLRPGTDDIKGDRILTQIQEQLWQQYGSSLPQLLNSLLLMLKDQSPRVVGYTGCNLAYLSQRL